MRPAGDIRALCRLPSAGLICLGAVTASAWVSTAHGQTLSFEPAAVSATVFSRPHDLTLSPDGRYLYVADVGNDVVQVLDPAGLSVVGTIGTGELSEPHDVDFDEQDRLLVADTGNDRVAIYAVEGASGRLVGSLTEGLGRTEGVVAAGRGRVYATSVARSEVSLFENGRRLSSAGGPGSSPNRYRRPHDIDLYADGRVIVADPGNNRLQILSPDLVYQSSIGGAPPYDFREPKYFAVDEAGRIYVADQYNHRVRVFDRQLKLSGQIGTGNAGDGPNEFNGLEGVTVRGNDVWISDTYNNRIVRYRRK
jgi:YVTN family beta-propeller protein